MNYYKPNTARLRAATSLEDKITQLTDKLLSADDPDSAVEAAGELMAAVSERIDRLRKSIHRTSNSESAETVHFPLEP